MCRSFLKKRMMILPILIFCLSGCVTIGPKVEERTVWVHPGSAGTVAESRTVKLAVKKKDGTLTLSKQNIGGWAVFPPDVWKKLKKELTFHRENCNK